MKKRKTLLALTLLVLTLSTQTVNIADLADGSTLSEDMLKTSHVSTSDDDDESIRLNK